MFRVEYKPDKENILKAGWMLKWPWTNIKSRQISTKSPRFGIIQFRKCEFEEVFMSHYQFHSPKSQGVQTETGLSHCIFSLASIFGQSLSWKWFLGIFVCVWLESLFGILKCLFCMCLAFLICLCFFWLDGVFGILKCLFFVSLAWWCVWHFETPFLAISPFVGGEIANFCIAAKWSWMRCQYFSLSFQPDKIKLDEKPILFSFFSIGQDKAGYKANTFSYFQPDMIKVDEKPILVLLFLTGHDQAGWKANTKPFFSLVSFPGNGPGHWTAAN